MNCTSFSNFTPETMRTDFQLEMKKKMMKKFGGNMR